MQRKSPSCLLGMSGGTDSSVAAMVLQDLGYTVIGVTFRFWEDENSKAQLQDAKLLANTLGIKHIEYDARSLFKNKIINYFIDEYLHGRTPVPCTKCNVQLKWSLLNSLARELNCEVISTGHYCNVIEKDGYYHISKGVDEDKDQSFFLWGLSQDILKKSIFPLGKLSKQVVRKMASEKGFDAVATKKDSLGLCFCADDYRPFLRKHATDFNYVSGNFVDEAGIILGEHKGYPFYTVGQRRGLGIHLNRAVFVKEIVPETNTVVLASLKSLYKTAFFVKEWTLINEADFTKAFDIITKIRYRKQATFSRIVKMDNGLLKIELAEPLESIAPGQAAVFYKESIVVGGGIIV